MDSELVIQTYAPEMDDDWDNLVINQSLNGNLFHTRTFLSYHPSRRFEDNSILIWENKTLVAVVAATKTEKGWLSHGGTSCGGPVIHEQYYGVKDVKTIMDIVNRYYKRELSIKLCEPILSNFGNELILYILNDSHSINTEVSAYKELINIEDFVESFPHKKTRSATRKLIREGFTTEVTSRNNDYHDFYELLTSNLKDKHLKIPTHNVEEILNLKSILGERQKLVLGHDADGRLNSGVWLIAATPETWHTQYIAKNYQYAQNCAVEATLSAAMHIARNEGGKYLNLGICTENNGKVINMGLMRFKESLGCKHHNRYFLTPNN
ncbi:MAG: hypothetical protein HN675_13445 [Opitutae bacterium]|jgi:hypothetical protein|nr:hypothetical protein [Opitutae bacterium]MBT5690564.1 hypothetical protein [Opitutae bacterium]MBT7854317.1 hypothetical protein [Opitutae bacterium]